MYFGTYRLRKTLSDHCVKCPASEHALTLNMMKCPKCFRNLHESVVIMCFYHFERI